ncbi:hypothetical protein [Dyadobacter alkalitolerans]|uniref:hypothetical protein n=1 Tax=Dyadobacter alkalitolerans TaxID=492736 RepID=UPI00040FE76F|nr:hypothetical protein [Dyadobacter alkalitolerans]
MFSTPILFIIFNRAEVSQRVFDEIRKLQPVHFYIAADGPRDNVPDDMSKCAAARAIVDQIDWPCNLKLLFREQNRGCGHGPAEAITWFFNHVEEGIILEDDCLPAAGFFTFCTELLERYRTTENISIISGNNPLKQWKSRNQAYIFSTLAGTWGWATWRRAWTHFDYAAADWNTEKGKQNVLQTLGNKTVYEHFAKEFDESFAVQKADVWDFQWYFCRLNQKSYGIVPAINLITNIGFGQDATHTLIQSKPAVIEEDYTIRFPLKHPEFQIDTLYDRVVFERVYNPAKRSSLKKVLLKVATYAGKIW